MLKPEASADGLSMHLAIPANIAANHAMTFDPGRYVWAVMPMGADFTYSIVYLLGGEMASRLLNFTILLVLLGLLYAALRRWVSPGLAWLLVTLFATTPMVQLVTGSLFVENLLAAMIFGAMMAIWSFGESGRAPLPVHGRRARRHRDGHQVRRHRVSGARRCCARRWRSGAAPAEDRRPRGCSPLGLLAADGRAALRHRVGQDRQSALPVSATRSSIRACCDPKAEIPGHALPPIRSPGTCRTISPSAAIAYYEGQDGSFGFQYLVLAPLALLALLVAPRRQAVAAAVRRVDRRFC